MIHQKWNLSVLSNIHKNKKKQKHQHPFCFLFLSDFSCKLFSLYCLSCVFAVSCRIPVNLPVLLTGFCYLYLFIFSITDTFGTNIHSFIHCSLWLLKAFTYFFKCVLLNNNKSFQLLLTCTLFDFSFFIHFLSFHLVTDFRL